MPIDFVNITPALVLHFCNDITIMKYHIYLIDFSCNGKVDQKHQYYCILSNSKQTLDHLSLLCEKVDQLVAFFAIDSLVISVQITQ